MSQLLLLFVALALCVLSSGADNEGSDCLFVSHRTGEDSLNCGSSFQPCRTLPQALRIVRDGGGICLDGRNSRSHPYGCLTMDDGQNAMKPIEQIMIQKSVTIQGYSAEAHISCVNPNDLIFATVATPGRLNVTLSNLVFHNSRVILRYLCAFNLVITKCRFMNCPYGVGIGQEESFAVACQTSTLVVTDSEFWYNENSIIVNLSNEFFNFTITRSLFQGKKGRFKVTSEDRNSTGSVYIISRIQNLRSESYKKMRVVGSVTDSLFRELGHGDNGFAFSVRIDHELSDGNLTLLNTSFLNNENSVFVHGGFGLRLTNVTINSTYGYAVTASGPPKLTSKALGINVFIDDCLLADNRVGIRMSTTFCLIGGFYCSTSDQTLVVRNSLFIRDRETDDSLDAIRFAIQRPKKLKPFEIKPDQKIYLSSDFEAKVILENVTFQELHGCALSVAADRNVHGLISVKNCKFVNNSQSVYRMVDRATVQIEINDEDPPKCRQSEGSNSSEFIWKNFRLPVIFENSIFEGNVGVCGALRFMNGNVTIKNCRFKNNEGLTSGGHVSMKTGYGRLNIENCSFLQTALKRPSKPNQQVSSYACFLHSESAGPVTIKSSSFNANVDTEFYDSLFEATKCSLINIDTSSTLLCPSGRQLKREEIVKRAGFELVEFGEPCWTNVNFVKLFCEKCPDGFYTLQKGSSIGLNTNKDTDCLKCPYGATCENGRIVAKENFWGFNISTKQSSLQFVPCPLEYCKTPAHSNYYNGCHGSRSGILCGQCSAGYSEALYSTSCRKKEKCNDHWFWIASLIYVLAFALYIIFKPPVFSLLYRQSLWFRKTSESDRTQMISNEDSGDEHDAGYLKIIFYFYQVAEVVMVGSPENTLHLVPFIPPIIALFNFQVKTIDGSIGCPFPGLNAVTKELFVCLKFLATLLSIGAIYGIHRGISKSSYVTTPSLALYLAAALETLLLGYETLADTTLKLMHCVPIGQDWRLFVDGSIQCWQWWQYLFIVFIVVFVFPLVLVLFWGSLMLSKDKVSAKQFLTSCAFPLPFLLIWLFRYWKKIPNGNRVELSNSSHTKEIKKILHDPFRPSSDGEYGTLYWESVLTGRRLILLTIHTFVTDPMIRLLCLNCACVMIMLHHVSSRPFRARKANICETFSLVSLVAISTFSLVRVTTTSDKSEPTGSSQSLLYALQWIEIAVLGLLPLVACILVVLAALSQVVRALYYCVRVAYRSTALAMSLRSSSRSSQDLFTVT